MPKLSLSDLSLKKGQRVLVRVDFNVPMERASSGGQQITDDTRVRAALPTIRRITDAGAVAVLMSHLGRPKGQPDPQYSLRPVAEHLEGLVDVPVAFSEEAVGAAAERAVEGAPDGSIVVLENTRFLPGETQNDAETARQLARLGSVFVLDAFGSAHRAHASTVGVTEHVETSAMGLLLEKEVAYLGGALTEPERPFVAVVGGAKVSDKIGVLKALVEKADRVLVGGAMAYTFLRGLGHDTGSSMVEEDRTDEAFKLYDANREVLVLPDDHVVADRFAADAETRIVEGEIEDGMGLDIGPQARQQYAEIVSEAKTVMWNGPMGVFEMEPFAAGTLAVAHAMAKATKDNGAMTVVGGGDSVAAVTQAGLADDVSHVSTGGGAMLEFIEQGSLPGLDALTDK